MHGLSTRRAAWDVLQAVAAGAYADVALDRVFRHHHLSSTDRGLVMELSYGAIRQRQWLDAWLDQLGKVPAKKQPPQLRWLLHVGLYQILKMQRVPPAAAVNTAVELAKGGKLKRLAPVVNAMLRSAQRAKDAGEALPLPKDLSERLAVQYSLPRWLVELLLQWRGESGAVDVAQACNQVPTLDLRVNRLLTTPKKVQEALAVEGVETMLIEGCCEGLEVLQGRGDLRDWPGYQSGCWCVQDRAAQWVSPLLNPKPAERVLDACAAPGGKATHLAELMGDRGELWAVDRSAGRLQRVYDNANRLGIQSLHLLEADASSLSQIKPEWRGWFDRILIDAPCSGLGTLARHPDARWRINLEKIDELIILQQKLLDGLIPLLASGGRLVYATCTIHPAENKEQVEAFLARQPELELLSEEQRWPSPQLGGDGFYTAVLQRRRL